MVSKDQGIGGAILGVCVIVALLYIVTLFYPSWLSIIGLSFSASTVQFWVIAVPVLVAFVAILFIGAWIGWTMATTPPPKPIEEITTDIEDKTPEPVPEPVAPDPDATATEDKPVIKKKK